MIMLVGSSGISLNVPFLQQFVNFGSIIVSPDISTWVFIFRRLLFLLASVSIYRAGVWIPIWVTVAVCVGSSVVRVIIDWQSFVKSPPDCVSRCRWPVTCWFCGNWGWPEDDDLWCCWMSKNLISDSSWPVRPSLRDNWKSTRLISVIINIYRICSGISRSAEKHSTLKNPRFMQYWNQGN